MLSRIVEGETDPVALSELALRRLKTKKSMLERALLGRVTDHHRFLLCEHMRQIEFLTGIISTTRRGSSRSPALSRTPSRFWTRSQGSIGRRRWRS